LLELGKVPELGAFASVRGKHCIFQEARLFGK